MTTPEVDVRIIYPEEIFHYWDKVLDSDITKVHPIRELAWQFGKVASNELAAVGFFENKELKGLCIFETKQVPVGNGKVTLHAVTRQIYAPYNARRFLPMFITKLREWGYTKLGGATVHNGRTMARLFGFRIVYAYIEKEI